MLDTVDIRIVNSVFIGSEMTHRPIPLLTEKHAWSLARGREGTLYASHACH